jgi:outer membrane protein
MSACACLALVLGAAPSFGQTPPPAAPPAGQAPPVATPVAPAASKPAPFPAGARVAYVNLQAIAQLSAEGKAAATKVTDFTQRKQSEIAEKEKAIAAVEQRLQAQAALITDEARSVLEKDIERQRRELERLRQDAQTDLNDLQAELQGAFNKKLVPILDQLATEKGLHFLFSAADAGLIWAAQGLDLTEEAVKRLDSAKP